MKVLYYTIKFKNELYSQNRRRKSGCEIAIDHYRNICKNATIQVIEKCPGSGYENRIKGNVMLD